MSAGLRTPSPGYEHVHRINCFPFKASITRPRNSLWTASKTETIHIHETLPFGGKTPVFQQIYQHTKWCSTTKFRQGNSYLKTFENIRSSLKFDHNQANTLLNIRCHMFWDKISDLTCNYSFYGR